jgi:hypothetical protein
VVTLARDGADGLRIEGAVRATCTPYTLSSRASTVGDELLVTLTAAVAGTACPQDVAWRRRLAVRVAGVPAEVARVRVLHTADLPGATLETLHVSGRPAR